MTFEDDTKAAIGRYLVSPEGEKLLDLLVEKCVERYGDPRRSLPDCPE